MSEQPPSSAPLQAAPNSSMAVVSLIAGILGLTMFPLLGSVVALITGGIAKREIRESRGALSGEGLATAGLVLGWIGVGLGVLGLCLAGALFVVPFCLAFLTLGADSSALMPMLLAIV